MYKNKKILILGAAKSGIAVAKLLANKNNDIILTDLNELNKDIENELNDLGVKIVVTKNQIDLIDSSLDLVIKNPAIMSTSPLIKRCEELNLRVENEIEVAYHFLPDNIKIIGVTGSNGKTTTTTIIYNMLKCLGKSGVMGGNIGTPLTDLLPNIKSGDILLLEISDHQLCDIHDFKTDISVLTNICPTHLDYHGTYEHYKMTKKKIFNKHTYSDLAIINYENSDAIDVSGDILSKKVYFSSNGNTSCKAYLLDDGIYLNNELVLQKEDIKLQGVHNYENIMAALLVVENFGLDIDKIKMFLKTFGGVKHRLEFVRNYNGVDFYNDSKSTNPTATITALKTFDKPIHLILGGLNRNQDFHELDEFMKNVKYIYAIGEVTDIVYDYACSMNIPCFKGKTLENAMEFLKKNISDGEVVLLSPASSSQDQYPHFENRGNEFKNIVEKF
jgi:UDP-N-acetylmuramoylalanine--D-glutamate ligase